MQFLTLNPAAGRKTGFTLIELMVVIMIISVLSGIVLVAMSGSDNSRSLDTAITKMDSLFSLARSAAITRKQKVRLLISFDDSNIDDPDKPQRLLRYATIVFLDDDGLWKIYSEGEYLPDGVYFSPAMSTSSLITPPLHLWTLPIDENTLAVTQPPNPNLTAAGNVSLSGAVDDLSHGAAANRWYAYEFAPNGTFRNPSARVVLVSGNLQGRKLNIDSEQGVDPWDVAKGFVVFRSGKIIHFQDGRQIKEGI